MTDRGKKMIQEKRRRDHWSEDDQVFYTHGKGYGLTDTLQTICLGSEEDIEECFETGRFAVGLSLVQRQVLEQILDYRREQGIGTATSTGTTDMERAGNHGATRRRPQAARLPQARKRLPLRPPRTKNKGLSSR